MFMFTQHDVVDLEPYRIAFHARNHWAARKEWTVNQIDVEV